MVDTYADWDDDGEPVKESIILTVADREASLLISTMRWLCLSDLSESEILIVDDGSEQNYEWLEGYRLNFNIRTGRMKPYDAARIGKNFNNPARAFNAGLLAAKGESVALVSSDVIVPPTVLDKARRQYDPDAVWCPMVVDLGTASEYCGPHRVFPMPWFLYGSRDTFVKAGGWDENYLQGMCYEDNDFLGRVALTADRIVCDWSSCVWHQSHYQPAYENKADIRKMNKVNQGYTLAKWTGMPFGDPDQVAFQIDRTRDPDTGSFCLKFKDIKNVRDKVMRETLSPFVVADVGTVQS